MRRGDLPDGDEHLLRCLALVRHIVDGAFDVRDVLGELHVVLARLFIRRHLFRSVLPSPVGVHEPSLERPVLLS